jgi:hypothetical protein
LAAARILVFVAADAVALGSLFKTRDTKLGSTFANKPTSRRVAFRESVVLFLVAKINSESLTLDFACEF